MDERDASREARLRNRLEHLRPEQRGPFDRMIESESRIRSYAEAVEFPTALPLGGASRVDQFTAPGSGRKVCQLCGGAVWISPEGLSVMRERAELGRSTLPFCERCVMNRADEVDAVRLRADQVPDASGV